MRSRKTQIDLGAVQKVKTLKRGELSPERMLRHEFYRCDRMRPVYSNGKFYISSSGGFASPEYGTKKNFITLDKNGKELDDDFSYAFINSTITAAAVDGDNLYFSTDTSTPRVYGQLMIGRVDPNTGESGYSNWLRIGASIDSTSSNYAINGIVEDGSGGFFLFGSFVYLNGSRLQAPILRVNSDGSNKAWASNSISSFGGVSTINNAVLNNGVLYIMGSFDNINGQTRNNVAAFNASTGELLSWNPNANSSVLTMAISGSTIYLGGTFTTIGGTARNRLAAVDSTTGALLSWNPNVTNGEVRTMVYYTSTNTIYVGGTFTSVSGGVVRNRAAAFNTSGTALSWNPNLNSNVNKILEISGQIYIGGDYTTVGGGTISRRGLGRFDLTNGTLDSGWLPVLNSGVFGMASANGILYLTGSFTTVNSVARSRAASIAISTPTTTTSWDPGTNNSFSPVYNENSILATSSFIYVTTQGRFGGAIGGVNLPGFLAAINMQTKELISWRPVANGIVRKIIVSGDNVYVFGLFTTISGLTRNRAAAISKNGVVQSWDPNFNGDVVEAKVFGSDFLVAGAFTTVSGAARNYMARIAISNAALSTWSPAALNGAASGFSVDTKRNLVYVTGQFSSLGGDTGRNGFAALSLTNGALSWHSVNADTFSTGVLVDGDMIMIFSTLQWTTTKNSSGIEYSNRLRPNILCINADTGAPMYTEIAANYAPVHAEKFESRLIFVGDSNMNRFGTLLSRNDSQFYTSMANMNPYFGNIYSYTVPGVAITGAES